MRPGIRLLQISTMRCQKLRYRNTTIVSGGPPGLFDIVRRLHMTGVTVPQTRWRPDADVYETDGDFTVLVELASVEDDDIDIAVFEDAVVIQGERRLGCEAGAVFHAAAICQGPFRLDLRLPSTVDPDRTAAHYDRGLLRIVLPKTEAR